MFLKCLESWSLKLRHFIIHHQHPSGHQNWNLDCSVGSIGPAHIWQFQSLQAELVAPWQLVLEQDPLRSDMIRPKQCLLRDLWDLRDLLDLRDDLASEMSLSKSVEIKSARSLQFRPEPESTSGIANTSMLWALAWKCTMYHFGSTNNVECRCHG